MRILIIGGLQGHIGTASKMALERGAQVTNTESINNALQLLRSGNGADLVMVDVAFDVESLISSLRQERIFVPVIGCGIGNDTQAAVGAIKAGAKEYVPLPPDAELIAAILEAISDEGRTIIHQDTAMHEVLGLAKQVASSNASVLITGESGTGKELIARYIHRLSSRAERKFVSVNCAAIPENLLESELFGHEKGAFTGAVARRIGKFEEANGGTLLLDEISEMDARLQAKLLRAIQEREIDRVGGSAPVKVDIRVIATTNRDLNEEVRKGNFREDLYFRINVVTVALPPLRDRPGDIDILARHFSIKYAKINDLPERNLSAEAFDLLRSHFWPGNVRELENVIHRAVLLSRGEVVDEDSILLSGQKTNVSANHVGLAERPTDIISQPESFDHAGDQAGRSLVGKTVAAVERDLIVDTLTHCLGNRTQAAGILGISIRTLRNKIRQYSNEGVSIPMPGDVKGAVPQDI